LASRVAPLHKLAASDRDAYGGKAANLGEMIALGLPVPAGFAVSVEACRDYWRQCDAGGSAGLTDELRRQVEQALRELEQDAGMVLGGDGPLLVSVRSGAAVSMPGMMNTILNVGICPAAEEELARTCGRAFANDCAHGLAATFEAAAGIPPPAGPREQVQAAIEAVFRSWRTPRAIAYRHEKGIPEDMGTAVVVQRMVFGNRNALSGTGVVFTRNPSTGAAELTGEFAAGIQGEALVAGEMTPQPLATLQASMPDAHAELARAGALLERHFRAVQDIEFTVESGKLYVLQTRHARLAPRAALVAAVDLHEEGLIDAAEALRRLTPDLIRPALLPSLPPEIQSLAVGRGLPACPGVASGAIAFTSEDAIERSEEWEVLLVRPETTPADLSGMLVAAGVLTARGGATSHAAVVARDLDVPCVVGCEGLEVDVAGRQARLGDLTLRDGDQLTIDGGSGLVLLGRHELSKAEAPPQLETLRRLAEEHARTSDDIARHAAALLGALP
jgi:pyruvate,orthophosphate dikinase